MHPMEGSGKERPSLSLHVLSSSSLQSIYAITPRSFFLSNADNHCMRMANLEMMAEHQAGLHSMLSGIRQVSVPRVSVACAAGGRAVASGCSPLNSGTLAGPNRLQAVCVLAPRRLHRVASVPSLCDLF
jgi:hypothetical protein